MIDVSPHRHATVNVHTEVSAWLTGPDELSRGRLVRLRWECDGDGVQERTK